MFAFVGGAVGVNGERIWMVLTLFFWSDFRCSNVCIVFERIFSVGILFLVL